MIEHREHPARRTGRIQQQYRAVCPACGWRTRWVVGRWFAGDRDAAHAATCSVPGRPVRIGVYTPGTPEWHAARMGGLGGSEIAAVLGISRYESHFALWHRKAGRVVDDRVNDEMTAGALLEPVIIGKFAADHPDFTVQRDAGTWRSAERPWQIANPDALVTMPGGRPALLETKFSLYGDDFGTPGTDQIPIYYRAQIQWYLDVFGLLVAYLMVFVGGAAEFREYVIPAREADQRVLRRHGQAFMDSLAAGRRPSIDGHDSTYDTVRALNPGLEGGTVPVPDEIARPFCAAKAAEAAAKVETKRATAVLADHMGNAQKATWDGVTIATRMSKNGGVPYVVAARNLPSGEATKIEMKEAS